jgi:SAM-dependent methyltransferase
MRFSTLIRPKGMVLDLACGAGRHARYLAQRGFSVEAVDRDRAALASLAQVPGVRTTCAELEGGPWPYHGTRFDGIVVTNYLHRPLFSLLREALQPGGVLIYETFMLGNERFGRPSNPDFLLRPGELLDWLAGTTTVVAFEQGEEESRSAVVQRICAVAGADGTRVRLPASGEFARSATRA